MRHVIALLVSGSIIQSHPPFLYFNAAVSIDKSLLPNDPVYFYCAILLI